MNLIKFKIKKYTRFNGTIYYKSIGYLWFFPVIILGYSSFGKYWTKFDKEKEAQYYINEFFGKKIINIETIKIIN